MITTPVFPVPDLWPALPEILLACGALVMVLVGAVARERATR